MRTWSRSPSRTPTIGRSTSLRRCSPVLRACWRMAGSWPSTTARTCTAPRTRTGCPPVATIETERKVLGVLALATDELFTREIQERAGVAQRTATYAIRDFVRLEWVTLRAATTGHQYYRITDHGR